MASEGQKFVGKGGQKCPHANVKSSEQLYQKKYKERKREAIFGTGVSISEDKGIITFGHKVTK